MIFTRRIHVLLFAVGVVAFSVVVWDLTMGGFYFTVGGVRVSSWEADKPFRYGMLAIVATLALYDRTAAPHATSWQWIERSSFAIAGAVAMASAIVAVRYGIFAAGGADGYGYVSQAHLWASRRIVVPDPLAPLEPVLGSAVAPLGYRLGPTPGTIVPIYAPGLPMAMAAALRIAGPAAVYFVVPLLGALTVWLTYVLGARTDRPLTGMLAAVLVAFSPIFMFHTLVPMSDVPATAWWMLAWVFAILPGTAAPLASGLAASAAILTRPNLVPLAIVLLAVVAAPKPRLPREALFAAGVVPGCLAIAAINARLYGSPLASGYGPFELLYAWNRWKVNLQHYAGWLVDLQTPLILLAFLAPVAARVRHAKAMLAFFGVLLLCYLWYLTYDMWSFLRFLLPAIPLLFILASAVVIKLAEALPIFLRSSALIIVATLLPIWYVAKADSLTVFDMRRAEQRYVAVGEHAGRALPANAIVLTVIESGSVRLYGSRPTVRWDMIEPERLDSQIDTLRTRGYRPYLLLEEWELPLFRERFGAASQYGRVDWPPAFEYRDIHNVRIHDFADRVRHLAHEEIVTEPVPNRCQVLGAGC